MLIRSTLETETRIVASLFLFAGLLLLVIVLGDALLPVVSLFGMTLDERCDLGWVGHEALGFIVAVDLGKLAGTQDNIKAKDV